MRLYQLTEAKAGTFVGVKFTEQSAMRLIEWMDQNSIKKPLTADELHVTLAIDKQDHFNHTPMTYDPTIPLDPDTYSMERFGEDRNVLVIKFDCPFLEKRHNMIQKKHDLTWDFPSYEPHISLSYEPQSPELDDLLPPTFVIELEQEYVEHNDEDR